MSAEPLHLVEPPSEFDGPPPPHDLGAEQMVLGSMMLSTDAAQVATDALKADDFYDGRYHTIFATLVEMLGRGEPLHEQAVIGRLIDTKRVQQVGGDPMLVHHLIEATPTAASVGFFVKRVLDFSRLRQLAEAASRIRHMARTPAVDVDVVFDKAAELYEAVAAGGTSIGMVPFSDLMAEALDLADNGAEQAPGIPTGLIDLDRLLGGLRAGQLIIVGGRPAMGKSVLCVDICRSASKAGMPMAIFSLEMSRVEVAHRILAAECRIPLQHWRNNTMQPDDWGNFDRNAKNLADMRVYVNDDANLTVQAILGAAREAKRRYGIRGFVVDYLQLVQAPPRTESRQLAVADIARRLKNGAKELGLAVVAACQINRGPTTRQDKRPMMSDLRESGELENSADVIILLHREDYYDKESLRSGEIDLIVDKNRHGSCDTITAASQLHLSRIADLAV